MANQPGTLKVVINRAFGGFNLSLEAVKYMADRGDNIAKHALKEYEKTKFEPFYRYCYSDKDRSNPLLVEAVETLKEKSSERGTLEVVELELNYEIDDYDGKESISGWVSVNAI